MIEIIILLSLLINYMGLYLSNLMVLILQTDENRKCYNLGMRCRRRGRKVISQINTMLGLVMVCN